MTRARLSRARARLVASLAASLAGCLALACADAEGGLLVRFLSERRVPDEAEALEVAVFSGADGAELAREAYELAPIGGFPATIGLRRGDATPARVRVEGRVSLGGAVIAAGAADTEFVGDVTRQVDVLLVDVP